MGNSVYNIFKEEVEIGDKVKNTEYTLYKKYGSDNGYKAALYRREIDGVEFFNLVFAGTDDLFDAAEDILATLSDDLEYQIKFAILDSRRINDWTTARGANFSMAGHSLGGALAAAGSGETGKYACTFNAMGISKPLQDKYGIEIINSKVDAYIIKGEVLNATQPFKANGIGHKLDSKTHDYGNDPSSLFMLIATDKAYLHSMSRFLEIYR